MEWAALLATVAAFTATIFGWWNVSRAATFAQANELQRWRRDVLLPAFTEFIEAADVSTYAFIARTFVEWSDADREMTERLEAESRAARQEVGRTNAKVELVATEHVHNAAEELRGALVAADLRSWRMAHDRSGAEDAEPAWEQAHGDVIECRERFVKAARESLGLPDSDLSWDRLAERLERKKERLERLERGKGYEPES